MTNKYDIKIILLFCIMTVFASSVRAGIDDKISDRLMQMFEMTEGDEPFKVWIYFRDKDESNDAYQKAASRFTSRTNMRRTMSPADWYDLPVKKEYIEMVEAAGGRDMKVSRWLNAVSARMTADQIEALSLEKFITKIEPVARAIRKPLPVDDPKKFLPAVDSVSYGYSYIQNHMLGADSLHRLGLKGTGVLLAFLDTGYMTNHRAFDSLTILETWNFIEDIIDVTDTAGSQTEHGTATLSACGGFDSGWVVGPAYDADYVLAKTEYKELEIQIEEDYWVAGAEWADSLGADIISSSLGYTDWYNYSDLDGNTAVTTIAADIAASRGILVVISAGNEGNDPWHYVNTPADADSVIAVGAVTPYEEITAFSSFGPTYDGRLKPEVSAMGSGVRCARDLGGYFLKSGTSLSCPLISGGAALILEANPSLRGNPMGIRDRLIRSSDRYGNPDFQYGNGIPDLVLAAGFGLLIHPVPMLTVRTGQDTLITFETLAPIGQTVSFNPVDIPGGSVFSDNGDGTASILYSGDQSMVGLRYYTVAAEAGGFFDTLQFVINTNVSSEVITVGPNPCSDSLRIFINENFPGGYKIEIFSISGEIVYSTYRYESVFVWPAVNQSGEKVASGVYILRFSADGIERKVKVYKM